MPSQTNLQGYLSEDMHFSGERRVGFWKSDNGMDPYGAKVEGMPQTPGSMPSGSSPLEKLKTVEPDTVKSFEVPDSSLMRDQNVNLSSHRNVIGVDKTPIRPSKFWNCMDHGSWNGPDFSVQSASTLKERDTHYENGLFSSSLSDLFSRKLRLTSNNTIYGHSVDTVASQYEEEEPFESLEEVEAQTIGNLLPNDDDLFSGVADGLQPFVQRSGADDTEDLDLFSIVGGMDLGDDDASRAHLNGKIAVVGEHRFREHPSRTLFVRNINSNVGDAELRTLFEQYGDIHTLYTACKQRGFVIISYYDIRAARNAMKALQSKPLGQRKLDIHYSIPKDNPSEKDINQGTLKVFNLDSSVSNDDLHQVFGVYGEIKEICETPCGSNHKFIEFYDVRAAEAALHAVNWGEFAGKMIKVELEPSHPAGSRLSSRQLPPEMDQDKSSLYVQQDSPGINNPTGFSGSLLHGKIASSNLESEPSLATRSGARNIIGPFGESTIHHGVSSSVPSGLSSLLRGDSARNHSLLSESACSRSQMKYDFGGMPMLHPHSLPDYHDGLANGAPCNSPGNMLGGSIGSLPLERVESTHLDRISMNQSVQISSGFCSSGNGSGSLPGHHIMWSNSNHPQGQPPSIMWQNSPFANGIHHPHPASRLLGLPRASHMLSSTLPVSSHHVGSAPVLNHSLWDRQNAYPMGSPEASGFHQSPLGSMRLSGSPLHHMDFVPRSMFPHVGGNGMDLPIPSRTVGLHSHHQRSVVYPSRSQMHHMSSSFEPSNDRLRGRRGNSSSAQLDNKKQYELDIDRILLGEDDRTTLMIKNIPNKYTSKMLMAAIDERHRGTYDFIYLPIDFKNKCNVGYAFINMIDPNHIVPFYESFNGKKWEKFNSEKVALLAYARIQGKAALIAHFQNSSLMNEDKRCRPILFHTDGPNAGDQVPFPMGLNFRSRPGRPRNNTSEDDQQGSPPSSSNKEESLKGDTSSGSGKDSE